MQCRAKYPLCTQAAGVPAALQRARLQGSSAHRGRARLLMALWALRASLLTMISRPGTGRGSAQPRAPPDGGDGGGAEQPDDGSAPLPISPSLEGLLTRCGVALADLAAAAAAAGTATVAGRHGSPGAHALARGCNGDDSRMNGSACVGPSGVPTDSRGAAAASLSDAGWQAQYELLPSDPENDDPGRRGRKHKKRRRTVKHSRHRR
jgi:hypothetical protein